MRVAILASPKTWEVEWSNALASGIDTHGDTAAIYFDGRPDADSVDAVAFVGVKGKEGFDHYRAKGVTTLLFDKGYNREKQGGMPKYWRVAINAHSCTDLIDHAAPHDRIHTLGVELHPWRDSGDHILYAGSSAKYHAFQGLPSPERYAFEVFDELSRHTDRAIHYRPKPSYRDAEPVSNALFDRRGAMHDAMKGVHAVVTHGSNACFEAVCAGIPCIVLGPGVARPISSTSLDEIERLRMASEADRVNWLAGLSYWQWTLGEMASGEAWQYVRHRIV